MNTEVRAFSVLGFNKESPECCTQKVSSLVLQSEIGSPFLFLFARLDDRPISLLNKYLISTFSQVLCYQESEKVLTFPYPQTHGCGVVSHCGFDMHFPMTNDTELLFKKNFY